MKAKYYTTKEAMEVLDVTKMGLLYMVKKHAIRNTRIEHWNRLMLLASDVDRLKHRPRKRRRSNSISEKSRISRWGYVEKYAPRHPLSNTSGFVGVHKLVMEEKIGRPLTAKETVHHLDGNKQNNSPDNLFLYASHTEHMKDGHRLTGFWMKWAYKLLQSAGDKRIMNLFIKELRGEIEAINAKEQGN